jgi:hypothetical protein
VYTGARTYRAFCYFNSRRPAPRRGLFNTVLQMLALPTLIPSTWMWFSFQFEFVAFSMVPRGLQEAIFVGLGPYHLSIMQSMHIQCTYSSIIFFKKTALASLDRGLVKKNSGFPFYFVIPFGRSFVTWSQHCPSCIRVWSVFSPF